MAEQSTYIATNLPVDGQFILSAQVTTDLNGLINEYNKQVPTTKISAEQPFLTYAPTWTATSSNPAIGNGSISGRYLRVARSITPIIYVSMGSTTTFGSGSWQLSLPFAISAGSTEQTIPGLAFDLSANAYYPVIARLNAGTDPNNILRIGAAGTTPATATSPFTWATGDFLLIQGPYESAS